MAERVNHPWFKRLILKNVSLGSGKRVVVPHGVLETKYNITIPRKMDKKKHIEAVQKLREYLEI